MNNIRPIVYISIMNNYFPLVCMILTPCHINHSKQNVLVHLRQLTIFSLVIRIYISIGGIRN